MHKEYILLNGFRKAKKDFTAGFHVPLIAQSLAVAANIITLNMCIIRIKVAISVMALNN